MDRKYTSKVRLINDDTLVTEGTYDKIVKEHGLFEHVKSIQEKVIDIY
jgi:hypothetical protein